MSLECIKRFDLYVVIEFMSRVNRMLHPNNFSQWFQFVIYSFDHERSRSGQIRNRTGLEKTGFGIGLIQSTLNKFLAESTVRKYSSVVWWNNNGYNRWYSVWLTWFYSNITEHFSFHCLYLFNPRDCTSYSHGPHPPACSQGHVQGWARAEMLKMLKEGINYFEVPAHS